MKKLLLFVSLSLTYTLTFAQDNYRTIASGNWNGANTWEKDNAGDLNFATTSTAPTSSNSISIFIRASNTATIPSGYTATVDEVTFEAYGSIDVSSGGTLSIVNGTGSDVRIYNDGIDAASITVSGTLILNEAATIIDDDYAGTPASNTSTETLTFNNGGKYQHNYNVSAGRIPIATWSSGSTCEVIGYTTANTAPSDLNQTYHHFTWNCPSQTASIDLGGTLRTINGNLTISATATSTNPTNSLRFMTSAVTTINIGGNFIIQGNSRVVFGSTGVGNIYNITGNLSITSATTTVHTVATTGTTTMNITGSFTLNASGNLGLIAGSGTGTLNVGGNYTITAGNVTQSSGTAAVNFNGTAAQTYSSTNTAQINYTIANNAIVVVGSSHYFGGAGTFTLNASGTLRVASTDGINLGTSLGNIRVSGTRTFTSGATLTYNGSSSQVLGDGFPANMNLNIDNSSGVSLSASTSIASGRTLTLTSGSLTIGAYTLTIDGATSVSAGSIAATNTSNLTIDGTGALGTIPFSGGTTQIGNFTLNRTGSGTATLGSNIDIAGVLDLENGDLIINSRTLTLSGTIDILSGSNAGFLSGNTSTSVIVQGSGAYGEINFQSSGSGNSIGTLTLDRTSSGSLTLGNAVTINSTANLTNGALTIDASLSMVSGTTLNRNGGASIAGTNVPTSSGTFNVTYGGTTAMSTGLELPTVASGDLNNLTVNTSQTVTLNKIISVGGNLSIASGATLNTDANNNYGVGLGGDFTNAGTYTSNTSTTTYSRNGTQTIGAATYYNLTVSGTGLKTLEGTTAIAAAGTLTLNGGDIDLNANTLTINNSSNTAISRTSGYIRSENTSMAGLVAWVVGTNNATYSIPFGNAAGSSLPLTVNTHGSNIGTLSAATYPTTSLFPNTPTSGGAADIKHGSSDNRNNTVTRFWQLNRSASGGTMNVDVTFSYPAANDPVSAPTQVRMQRWNGTSWDAALAGQTSNVGTTPRTITVPGISSFSPWGGADESSPLPVDLDHFNATLVEDYVNLDWATLTESKSSHFIIERSPKMDNFKPIGNVASAGNSSEKNEYLYKDMSISYQSSNILYYRLRQVDKDGQYKIYPAKAVDISNIKRESKIKIHPNPSRAYVNVSSISKEPYNLIIYNQVGDAVYQERIEKESKINVSGFPKGVYIFKCVSSSGIVNTKVVVE